MEFGTRLEYEGGGDWFHCNCMQSLLLKLRDLVVVSYFLYRGDSQHILVTQESSSQRAASHSAYDYIGLITLSEQMLCGEH